MHTCYNVDGEVRLRMRESKWFIRFSKLNDVLFFFLSTNKPMNKQNAWMERMKEEERRNPVAGCWLFFMFTFGSCIKFIDMYMQCIAHWYILASAWLARKFECAFFSVASIGNRQRKPLHSTSHAKRNGEENCECESQIDWQSKEASFVSRILFKMFVILLSQR